MSSAFFEKPILNSPYEYPHRHWQLENGQPTGVVVEHRRRAEFITPIPKPRRRTGGQADLLDESLGLSGNGQKYDPISIVNEIRQAVDAWRRLPRSGWQVTPETGHLLEYWRTHGFQDVRPFFCQIEAVETAIWLAEVAPRQGKRYAHILESLESASLESSPNPRLIRTALKLATGAGKTTVMALIIAWQTVNAARHPASRQFTRGFLIVTPGITIRDRLRVLLPNDPDNYYKTRELLPSDMLADMQQARIVITNYHAFKLRERMKISKGGRALLGGRMGEAPRTLETEGQMLQRVIPDLMGMTNVLVINDEAHHCYRAKPTTESGALKGDEKKEADSNNEAARLWISGLEAVARMIGRKAGAKNGFRVFDLSATPFFLRGSGYAEGALFPWTVCDFSLMDAIESGIVKLPRVPVASNIPNEEMPMYRNLWEHIGKKMPRKGRGKSGALDPLELPLELQTALEALYGHYVKTFELWEKARIKAPPCFIIVCNNTASSKLVYDYISGFMRRNEDGSATLEPGHLLLFRNHDEHGEPLARPRTLLIDSEQLESGEALDKNFRDMAAPEIERFRREIIECDGNSAAADSITDQDLLREAMNTVGKTGRLGECLVPYDYIPIRSWPLFRAEVILRSITESHQHQKSNS
jgi:type III restriction enzyme